TVFAVVGGYWLAGYPNGIMLRSGEVLTWPATAAPEATLQALAVTLVVASLLILPGLAWLYRIFKTPDGEPKDSPS
ncbi:MAG: cytochrome bd-type quinol oxidase subunit 2, partial [Bradymonadia bacterium]